jgi:hypothetical protein
MAQQSRLAWFESHGRWTVCTLAAERNDQNGFDSLAQITGVERHDQDPMTHWRVTSIAVQISRRPGEKRYSWSKSIS